MAKKTDYATVQIDRKIKDIIFKHCDSRGLKLGKYLETLVRADYSSSFKISNP